MRRRLLSCVVALIFGGPLVTPAARAAEALLARHPAPSPDGAMIAFSWQGDLWLVPAAGGQARRLTAHPAADRYPVWSRDGAHIAFASDREGNPDVYVLATDASAPPRRLTFASVADTPVDFDADGKSVLFVSRRDESARRSSALYRVPLEGGTPSLVQPALALWASVSPDGLALATVRGASPRVRSGYRGSANRDIWLSGATSQVRFTAFDGDDDFPVWLDAASLAFTSARAGRKNVFASAVSGGTVRQLTAHADADVRWLRGSADGSLLAYELGDGIWTLRPGAAPERLRIEVSADSSSNPVARLEAKEGAGELALSPDGELAAFVLGGDVFVTAVRSKADQAVAPSPTLRLTSEPGQDRDIAWSPDGSSLLLSSDWQGSSDLYLLRRAVPERSWLENFEFPVERLTSADAEERGGRFSPDGRRIAFVRGRGNLLVMAADGSGERLLATGFEAPRFDWSPDGRFIAYSMLDMAYNSEVFIVAVDAGEPYNVSRHPDLDEGPRWSPDGRRLVWVSRRRADSEDIWGVWLTRADAERSPEEWLREFKAREQQAKQDKKEKTQPRDAGDGTAAASDAAPKAHQRGRRGKSAQAAAADPKAAPAPLPALRIDFDGLWQRVHAITRLEGEESEPLVTPDGRALLFSADIDGERDLYKVRWDGKELERLTREASTPTALALDAEGETVFYLHKKGGIRRVGLDGKAGDAVPFEARREVDARAEAEAVFDEAWREIELWFYDPGFHGVDWAAVKARYRPWALAAAHPDDYEDVMNLMLGELNASHLDYRPRASEEGVVTGWTGALYETRSGGVFVREVLPDSPAASEGVALEVGERLVSIGGRPVGPQTNVYALLAGSVKQPVPIELEAADGARRSVVLRPVSFDEVRQLRYRGWTRERRAIVEARSGGRLGYLHIQGMSIPSFEEFERDLFAAADGREGLIIDVRSNGGGWTTDYLMAALSVRRHAHTVPRGGDPATRAYPQERLPLAAWTRPALALCNEESFSNAEIFAHAFKTLERGPVVGTQTFGGVISTGGTTLVNGAWLRLPLRGWYIGASEVDMELHGAVPDVAVEQPPDEDTAAQRDTQLERAVEVLLERLASDPRRGAW